MASIGKAVSMSLVSCSPRTSGECAVSQSSTCGRRTFREFTFQLAIRMGSGRRKRVAADAGKPQQGPRLGRAAAERDEGLERIDAAADLEDALAETPAGLRVHDPAFLEQAEGVRGKHLGPLVAVVPGRVAAAENMRKAVREAVEPGVGHDRDLATHRLELRDHT